MTSCAVNIFYDPTLGINFHHIVPPPIPGFAPSIEMICLQMWTLGYLTGQNKFTTTVTHKRGPIVLEGHDIGMMIPDVTIPPVNAYYAIMWPFSSRKVMFTSSTVKMDDKMVGCAQFPFQPMMTCGDPVTAPTSFPLINLLNTVSVGLLPKDIWLGFIKIGVSLAIDAAFFKKPHSPINWVMEAIGKIVPTDFKAILKKEIQILADTAISFYEGKPKLEVKVGMPGVVEVGVTVTPGNLTAEGTLIGGQDNAADAGPWRKASYERDAQGDWAGSVDGNVGKPTTPVKK